MFLKKFEKLIALYVKYILRKWVNDSAVYLSIVLYIQYF